jgi:hypothetical protein
MNSFDIPRRDLGWMVLFILGINAFHFVIHIGDFLLGVKQQITFFWEIKSAIPFSSN